MRSKYFSILMAGFFAVVGGAVTNVLNAQTADKSPKTPKIKTEKVKAMPNNQAFLAEREAMAGEQVLSLFFKMGHEFPTLENTPDTISSFYKEVNIRNLHIEISREFHVIAGKRSAFGANLCYQIGEDRDKECVFVAENKKGVFIVRPSPLPQFRR